MAKKTTRLTTGATEDEYSGQCPFCGAVVVVSWADGQTVAGFQVAKQSCTHYRRAWIVAADQRRRAEFSDTAPPTSAAA